MLLWLLPGLNAQPTPTTDYDQLLDALERSMLNGEKRALRDIGTLLDKPEAKNKARRLLKNYTLFTKEEFEITNPLDKQDFLSFYYDLESQISYSDLTNCFFITPLEKRKIQYKIRALEKEDDTDISVQLKKLIQEVHNSIKENDAKATKKFINKVGRLEMEEAYLFLFDLVIDAKLTKSELAGDQEIYETIVNAAQGYPDFSTVRMVIHLAKEQKITPDFAQAALANITNVKLSTLELPKMEERYEHYMDSLSTMEDMRRFGYERTFKFSPLFFMHQVDYYGRILSLSQDMPWMQHNAIMDLITSQHPRSLYYLSGLLYKNRKTSGKRIRQQNSYLVYQIQKITQVDIGVPGKNGPITYIDYIKRDRTAKLNYFVYWAAHYNDYEWDENRNFFVNKFEAIEKTQNYERLFRRLNSRNNEVALASFVELTEGDPSEVVALAEKYRQMFRTYNVVLPSFQFKYLEQLALLTNYCRKNNIRYKASDELLRQLETLKHAASEKDRYRLENKIINTLDLKDITALEYWACVYEGNSALSFSAGRILDWFYSKNWHLISDDETQLRLYLKKTQIFRNIGAIGTCNSYINKIDANNPHIQKQLQNLRQTETDKGIISELTQLITQTENEDDGGVSTLEFLEDPGSFNKRDIKVLPPPTKEHFAKIIEAIQSQEDLKAIKYILYYVRLHPRIDMVPHLFKLKNDDRILIQKRGLELTVADNLAPIMENIYNYSFPSTAQTKKFNVAPWIKKWEEDSDNYRNWVDRFFEQKLVALKSSESLSIEDINQITESVHYSEKYKKFCLESLKKVKPTKDIRRLSITPKLLEEDLVYFENLDFTYKALDDIPKLFEIKEPKKILDFLSKIAANFEMTDRGSFYNNLFRSQWFTNYLSSGQIENVTAEKIKTILKEYFNNSDYLSEFEEQAIQLNIAKLENAQKTLEDQLLASIKMDTDESARMKIQQDIIAQISYAQIPQVINLTPQLSPELADKVYHFLSTDFGIPVFDLKNEKERNALIANHESLSEFDFYQHYLTSFGVDFLDEKGELSYSKIYDILKYDLITPFVSSSGGKRDYYTYGIIKLLEIKFNDRLGFHEKLNESQTFYSFSSAKRSAAWVQYLLDKKLINPDNTVPPSFSPIKAEN